jgi:hypothetical protein
VPILPMSHDVVPNQYYYSSEKSMMMTTTRHQPPLPTTTTAHSKCTQPRRRVQPPPSVPSANDNDNAAGLIAYPKILGIWLLSLFAKTRIDCSIYRLPKYRRQTGIQNRILCRRNGIGRRRIPFVLCTLNTSVIPYTLRIP